MGQHRDAAIREFQERAGIEPETGRRRELIEEMKKKAVGLLEVLVLEETGIRDGDGSWTACNVLEHYVDDIQQLYREYMAPATKGKPSGWDRIT